MLQNISAVSFPFRQPLRASFDRTTSPCTNFGWLCCLAESGSSSTQKSTANQSVTLSQPLGVGSKYAHSAHSPRVVHITSSHFITVSLESFGERFCRLSSSPKASCVFYAFGHEGAAAAMCLVHSRFMRS